MYRMLRYVNRKNPAHDTKNQTPSDKWIVLKKYLKTVNKKSPNKTADRFLNTALGPDKFIGLEVEVDRTGIWRLV